MASLVDVQCLYLWLECGWNTFTTLFVNELRLLKMPYVGSCVLFVLFTSFNDGTCQPNIALLDQLTFFSFTN